MSVRREEYQHIPLKIKSFYTVYMLIKTIRVITFKKNQKNIMGHSDVGFPNSDSFSSTAEGWRAVSLKHAGVSPLT